MFPKRLPLLFVLIAFGLTGCAIGTPFEEAVKTIPEISAGKGRVFVYRTRNPLLMAFVPTFVLDGKPTATTLSGNSFFLDIAPGEHTATSEKGKSSLKFTLAAGQTKYIRYTFVVDSVAEDNTQIIDVPEAQAKSDLLGTQLVKPELKFQGG